MVMTSAVQPKSAAIEARFEAFRQRHVDLPPDVTKHGRDLRDWVIGQLEGMSGGAGFPDLLIGQSFGAGSFGRRTKEQPLDDIDIYIVMSGGGLTMYHGGTPAPVELVGSTPGVLASDPALVQDGWVSSALILARVVSHLPMLGYPSGANTKAKSAYVKINNINVDICPVIWGRSTIGEVDRYYLPAGHGSYWWTKTNPKLDQARLTDENQRQDGLLLPLVRIMKWWNDNCNAARIKGIHLEVMVTNAVTGVVIDGMAPTLHWLFARLQVLLDQPCADPTGLGSPLDSTLATAERVASNAALAQAQQIAATAAACLAEGTPDLALAYWRRLFPI